MPGQLQALPPTPVPTLLQLHTHALSTPLFQLLRINTQQSILCICWVCPFPPPFTLFVFTEPQRRQAQLPAARGRVALRPNLLSPGYHHLVVFLDTVIGFSCALFPAILEVVSHCPYRFTKLVSIPFGPLILCCARIFWRHLLLLVLERDSGWLPFASLCCAVQQT